MSDPRPAPDSEVAGEPEYGNDTGFAAESTSTESTAAETTSTESTAGETGSGSGADSGWTSPTSEPAAGEPTD